ncbi:ABC transporter permease [Microbacterium sp. 18062]|uniref:ABC transporter permease n=1 Tax=Microbacterium sp. 18062 TaxID=2681410 RepID=UPI00135BDADC|nr:ABC transporter permease [Microbacterium sp. 18062]
MDVIASAWQTATPLILAALAGALAQRTGIWHLGLGGLMSIGALLAVVAGSATGSMLLGVGGAVLGCMAFSAIMWAAIVPLRANPIIVGIGINAIGLGGTTLAVVAIYGREGTVYSDVSLPRPLDFLPGALGNLSVIALLAPVVIVLVWILACRTRFGLALTATGDYPFAARSAGISLPRMRLWALLLGGALCALSGAELAAGPLGAFSPGMEAGRGLIAFAAVILGAAHPLGVAAAALFFGAVNYLGIWAQINWSGAVDPNIMLMLPYVVTVIAVVVTARLRGANKKQNLGEMRSL